MARPRPARGQEAAAWLDGRRDALENLVPQPTVCIFSGRGEWWYWKLSDSITKAEFERVNRLLPRIAGSADTGSWSPEHWARLPGSLNEKTGELAVVRFISDQRYEARPLVIAIEWAARRLGIDAAEPVLRSAVRSFEPIVPSVGVPTLKHPAEVEEYVATNPTKNVGHKTMGIDRSALDMRIIAYAVNQGCSDGQIKSWFEDKHLRRYMGERDRGHGDAYLARAIQKARNGWKPSRSSSYLECVYTESDHKPDQTPGRAGKHVDSKAVMAVVAEHDGAAYKLMLGEISRRLGCSEVTARRRLKQLVRAGYVALRQGPGRGRPKVVVISERGLRYLGPRDDGLPAMFTTLWTQPMRVNKTKADPKPATPIRLAQSQPAKRAKVVSDRTRKDRLLRQLERDQIGPYPRISFEGTLTRTFMQVLTPFDEIATTSIDVHDRVKVGYGPLIGGSRLPILRPFIRATWVERDDGRIELDDPFGDRFSDHYSMHRFLAVAAQLEQTTDGFKLATKALLDVGTGEIMTVPAVGLILESSDFWSAILRHADLEDQIFSAVRHGKRPNRTFNITAAGTSIDFPLPPDATIDRTAAIAEWSNPEIQQAHLDHMPNHWVPYIVRDPRHLHTDLSH